MKKIVLLVILGALAWWYFDGSRKLTEEQVRAHYMEQNRIMTALEKENACAGMADDYHLDVVSHTPGRPETAAFSREQACDAATAVFDMFDHLRALSGGQLQPSVRQEYKSITLSPDRKTATVEYSNKLLLGDRLLVRSVTTETLIRRTGKVLSLGGRTESWGYR